METYILDAPNGEQLEIKIDGNRATATILNVSALTCSYQFKNLDINFISQEIAVYYCYCKSVSGEDLSTEERKTVVSPAEFNYFLNLADLNANKILKHCLNGILYKEYGFRCFNESGVFVNFVEAI